MSLVKYIGPTQTFKAAVLNPKNTVDFIDISVETGQFYDIDITPDQSIPIMFVNGQQVFHPDTTLWVTFLSLGGRVPYAPVCLMNHWEVPR